MEHTNDAGVEYLAYSKREHRKRLVTSLTILLRTFRHLDGTPAPPEEFYVRAHSHVSVLTRTRVCWLWLTDRDDVVGGQSAGGQ